MGSSRIRLLFNIYFMHRGPEYNRVEKVMQNKEGNEKGHFIQVGKDE